MTLDPAAAAATALASEATSLASSSAAATTPPPATPSTSTSTTPLLPPAPGPGPSAHAAALASLPGRLAVLEARVVGVAERVVREPLGVDPLERQQADRLAGLLARLRSEAGADVRDTAARDTWRLVGLSQRGPP
ncbi:hypothetical protein Agub_g12004, partial [Astrephomene gubernaculifera]